MGEKSTHTKKEYSLGPAPLEIYAVLKRWLKGTPQFPFMSRGLARSASLTGFSPIELLVVISIITLVSVSVILSFSGVGESIALNRAARELAHGIRRAQNTALAVTQVPIVKWPEAVPESVRIVRHVGIQLTTGSGSTGYFLFVDIDAPGVAGVGPADRKYEEKSDGNADLHRDEKIAGSDFRFERNIRIAGFTECSPCPQTINIIFSAPEATAQIVNQDGGSSIGQKLDIELRAPSGSAARHVIIRSSGQVSIR